MAPTVPGVSKLCKTEDALIASLSESAAFQGLVGAIDATAAKLRIHVGEVDGPAADDEYDTAEKAAVYPLALIMDGDEGAITFSHSSDGHMYGYTCQVEFQVLIQAARQAGNFQDEHRRFKDICILILEQVISKSGQQGYMPITFASAQAVDLLEPEEVADQKMSIMLSLIHEPND